ncbi:MAG: Uma2 family endonuclease [Anaerolineae bacterium]|nr:Uma2 family endonuclease [Anaerolineae bacterium]
MIKTQILDKEKTNAFILHMQPVINLTDDQLLEFCRINRDLQIERTAEGDLVIMSPVGAESSWRNSELTTQVHIWSKQDGTGIVFDSSGGFILPNGAMRAPDVAWVKRSRLAGFDAAQKKKFLPLCPDFVIELRSASDRLQDLQSKMEEYVANGLELGWLINPEQKQIYVYDASGQVTQLDDVDTLSGEPVLVGFTLNLKDIWTPDF